MKRPAYDKEALRENKGGMQVGQPSADPQQTQETTRTQITPDDISDDGPIAPASANGTPSRQQIEQDVVAVNPSVDSMESRAKPRSRATPPNFTAHERSAGRRRTQQKTHTAKAVYFSFRPTDKSQKLRPVSHHRRVPP